MTGPAVVAGHPGNLGSGVPFAPMPAPLLNQPISTDTQGMELLLSRLPIFDRQERIVAYAMGHEKAQ